MALPTFNPIVRPSPGTGFKPDVKLLEADFGEGYSQPTPDGMNYIRQTLTLAWDGLTETQMHSINDFFWSMGGYKAFYYTPAGQAAPMKFTCKEWDAQIDGVWKMTATLVQSFTLET